MRMSKTIKDLFELHAQDKLIGIFTDIPIDVYHAGPGHSSSGIIEAKNYNLANYRGGIGQQRIDTEDLIIGKATHIFILENDTFSDRVTFFPDEATGRSKAAQEFKDLFEKAHVGKIILKNKESFESIAAMAESLNRAISFSEVPNILNSEGAVAEASCYHKDDESGLLLKVRPDLLHEDIGLSVNFKTAKSAKRYEFEKSAGEYRYDIQTPFYLNVLSAIFKKPFREWHVVVEKEPPYRSAIYYFDQGSLDAGEFAYRPIINAIAQAEKTGVWPMVSSISTPNYILQREA